VDQVKMLVIPDIATTLSALRTGKIDLVEDIDWQQAKSLASTNPQLLQVRRPLGTSPAFGIRVDKSPFTDIRVRKALQMAIDLQTMSKTYYGGSTDGIPVGLISTMLKEYYAPYEEWPADVKASYAYNPEGAKKLLVEAGYPQGFKTNLTASSTFELDLAQIAKSYFSAIGVDMEIRVMDPVAYTAFTKAMKHDALFEDVCAQVRTPSIALQKRLWGSSYNLGNYNDSVFNELWVSAGATLDRDEQKKLTREGDLRAISLYWSINFVQEVSVCVYQPWFERYTGQVELNGPEYARAWINQDLKKTMGH
jgi:peptide/nickel transport system substrate-binding protein